jgi:PAS domain S-box-containing protein
MADRPREVSLPEAAGMLRLPVETLQALVGAGYLHPTTGSAAEPTFSLGDLKGFLARNAEDSPETIDLTTGLEAIDPAELLEALEQRADDMGRRALDLFTTMVPEAGSWTLTQQARFVEQARQRFEAILAVTAQGREVDPTLLDELASVGADAANTGSSLAEVLLVLRISRDLVVQTAVEVAEERGRHWGLALSLLLTRVLPALDRLTDSVARGYWQAVVTRDEESKRAYGNVVERLSDGVYEIDLAGTIRYANPSLAVILGRRRGDLVGSQLIDVLDPATSVPLAAEAVEVAVRRPDGVVRVLDIRSIERREGDHVVGYDGVVRDITAHRRLEEQRNDFLALLTQELRQPLTVVVGLASTLESHGREFDAAQAGSIGASIRQQSERITRLTDDLFTMSQLEPDALLLSRRHIDLRAAVDGAVASVPAAGDIRLDVAERTTVLADRRRLEQVVANLIENALVHGESPIVVEAEVGATDVTVSVRDHGSGVDPERVPTLFTELRLTGFPRRRRYDTGLGLALVRGLVEAMGGRVWYEQPDTGGACFLFTVPRP